MGGNEGEKMERGRASFRERGNPQNNIRERGIQKQGMQERIHREQLKEKRVEGDTSQEGVRERDDCICENIKRAV